MKTSYRWIVSIAFWASCSALVFGQGLLPNISLDVRSVASGGAVKSANSAKVGSTLDQATGGRIDAADYSSTRTRSTATTLDISLHNFRQAEQGVVVRTLFFAKAISGNAAPWVQRPVVTPVNVPGSGDAKTTAVSKSVQSVTQRTFSQQTATSPYTVPTRTTSGSDTTQGEKTYGWVVAVEVDGRIIRTRTSNSTLEALLRDPDWIYQTTGLSRPAAAPAVQPAAPAVPDATAAHQPAPGDAVAVQAPVPPVPGVAASVQPAARAGKDAAPAGGLPPTPPSLE